MRLKATWKTDTVLAGYYGFGNAGDELILKALVERCQRRDPASSVIVLSRTPAETQRWLSVEAVQRWNPFTVFAALWTAKRFILGGGGLLQESTGARSSLYYLFLAAAAKVMGARVETEGLGVDPIEWAWNSFAARVVFRHFVDRIGVRDAASKRALEACGAADRMIYVERDLVFDLPVAKKSAASPSKILLAVSPWHERAGWDLDLTRFVQRLQAETKCGIDLIPFFPEQDETLARLVAAGASQVAALRLWSQPEQLLGWMADYRLVLGTRYHALVLAAHAEIPYVGWGREFKVRRFCLDMQAPFWDFDRGWDAERVLSQAVTTLEKSKRGAYTASKPIDLATRS